MRFPFSLHFAFCTKRISPHHLFFFLRILDSLNYFNVLSHKKPVKQVTIVTGGKLLYQMIQSEKYC